MVIVSDCVFCGIVAGSEPAQIVREWTDAIAFVPLNPVIDGHVLVIPRVHVEDALESPMITVFTVARTIELALDDTRYDACNILTSVGTDATQSIFHLHVHCIPRHHGDRLMLPWGTNDASEWSP
jgi:histidine triad (HIT) family protein